MTDNMKDGIRKNMLDGLLADEDKPTPPKQAYAPRPIENYDWSKGDSPSLFDDDGPDPLDTGYSGYNKPSSGGRGASVFSKRTSHENVPKMAAYDDWDQKVSMLMKTVRKAGGRYVMEVAERNELADLLVKMIGVQLDKVGLTWGTPGLKAFRESMKDLVPMAYYSMNRIMLEDDDDDGRIGELPDGSLYDRETGELL